MHICICTCTYNYITVTKVVSLSTPPQGDARCNRDIHIYIYITCTTYICNIRVCVYIYTHALCLYNIISLSICIHTYIHIHMNGQRANVNTRAREARVEDPRRAGEACKVGMNQEFTKGGLVKGGLAIYAFPLCNCNTFGSVFNVQIENMPNS